MNLLQRAIRSCFRKPVKSLLLLLVVVSSVCFSCLVWQAVLQTLLRKTVHGRPSAQDFYWNIIQRAEANDWKKPVKKY